MCIRDSEKTPYVDSGVWKIILAARNIKNGEYFLWLPGGKTLNPGTAFYLPRPQGTLTIPATARRVISVGAYDARQNTYADFSGRGCRALPYPCLLYTSILRIRDNVNSYNPFDLRGDEVDRAVMEMIKKKAKYYEYQRKLVFNYLYVTI